MRSTRGVLIVVFVVLAACTTRREQLVAAPPDPPSSVVAAASPSVIAAPARFAFDPVRAGTPFIRRWLLLGPFESRVGEAVTPSFIDEASAAPQAGDQVASRVWGEHRVAARCVDLGSEIASGELSTAYALTYLHVSADTDAVLWLGADNMSRMLLDARVVHEDRMRDRHGIDLFPVAVHLTAGVHRLLIRIENTGGPHRFWLRIADAAGRPVPRVVPSLTPDDDRVAAAASAAAANATNFTPDELFALLPIDVDQRIGFDRAADLMRVAATEGDDDCPRWRYAGGPTYGPSPGRCGALLLHPAGVDVPQRAFWKIHVPQEPSALRLVVSAESFASPGEADAVLRAYVFDGKLRKLAENVIASLDAPSSEGWDELTLTLPPTSLGRDVLIVLEARSGGRSSWWYEGVWFDEIAVVPAK